MRGKYDGVFATLRKKAGLTQQELSDMTGINLRHICKMEAGVIKMKNITLANAVALSRAFGVAAEALLEDHKAKE